MWRRRRGCTVVCRWIWCSKDRWESLQSLAAARWIIQNFVCVTFNCTASENVMSNTEEENFLTHVSAMFFSSSICFWFLTRFTYSQLSYYVFTIYIPTFMTVCVSWMSFWLDHKSAPARVALTITTLLAMSTTTSSINSSLPPVAYTKVGWWCSDLCAMFDEALTLTKKLPLQLCSFMGRHV